MMSCDWGTTRFRLRLVEMATERVAGEVSSAEGAQALATATPQGGEVRARAYRDHLAGMIGVLQAQAGVPLGGVTVIISGMAGSSIGWREVPYARLPVEVDGHGLRWEEMPPVRIGGAAEACPAVLVSGLATANDVLRGEEVEAIGVLQHPAYRAFRTQGALLLPGTHTKHLVVRDEQIVDFRTHMTGELLALLGNQSVLRHSVTPDALSTACEEHPDAFRTGVETSADIPLTRALFQVRTRQLLQHVEAGENTAFLLGLLLGVELRDLLRDVPPACPMLLCAGGGHAASYRQALIALGAGERTVTTPTEVMRAAAVAGHLAVWRAMYA